VYQGYIEGIMGDDEGGSLDQRIEAVLDLLGSAVETDLTEFGECVRSRARLAREKDGC
jgi:hypothetical protein